MKKVCAMLGLIMMCSLSVYASDSGPVFNQDEWVATHDAFKPKKTVAERCQFQSNCIKRYENRYAERSRYIYRVQHSFKRKMVHPQGEGNVQFSLLPEFSKPAGAKKFKVPVVTLIGLTPIWQMSIEWESYKLDDPDDSKKTQGIGDVTAGTQVSMMNFMGTGIHFALGLDLTAPIGNINKDLTDGFMNYNSYMILGYDVADYWKTHLFLSFGFEFLQRVKHHTNRVDDDPAAHKLDLGAGIIFPLKQISLTCEFDWKNNKWNNDGQTNDLTFTPGIVYRMPPKLQFGLGTPIGLTSSADNYAIIGMITYEFNVLK